MDVMLVVISRVACFFQIQLYTRTLEYLISVHMYGRVFFQIFHYVWAYQIHCTMPCERKFFLWNIQIQENNESKLLPTNNYLHCDDKTCLEMIFMRTQVLWDMGTMQPGYNLEKNMQIFFEKSTMYDCQILVRQGLNPNFPLCTIIRCCTLIRYSRVPASALKL